MCTLKGYAPLIKEREVPFWEVVPCRGYPIMERGIRLIQDNPEGKVNVHVLYS